VEFISAPVGGQKTPVKVLSKHYKARRRRRIVTGLIAGFALGAIVMSFVLVQGPAPRRVVGSPASPGAGSVVRTETVAAPGRSAYRHSVVPGGVRSPEEIAYVMQRDQVVAAHYKNVVPQLMRNQRLQQPLLAHVSYRIGDKVYWTKKPVHLPKNEPVMTDGNTMIRERCGNLISMEPLAPVSEEEPALPSFDLPMDPMEFAWMRLDYTPPGVRRAMPGSGRGQPSFLSAAGPVGTPGLRANEQPGEASTSAGTFTPVEAPLPVPEPNTLTLLGLGGAAGVAHYLRKRAQARRRN
jgi:hypothetical protein